jgi:hypothetical protein
MTEGLALLPPSDLSFSAHTGHFGRHWLAQSKEPTLLKNIDQYIIDVHQ